MAANNPQVSKVGRYRVQEGGKDVKFWPLDPAQLDHVAGVELAEAEVLPTTEERRDFSTLVLPPEFGIFDILVEFSKDELEEKTVSKNEIDVKLYTLLMGKPSIQEMELILGDERTARISFAAYIDRKKTFFEGTLKAWAKPKGKPEVALQLPIKVEKRNRADKLFLFYIVHAKTNHKYCWFQIKTVEGSGGAAIEAVTVKAKVLREQSTYKQINRRTELVAIADGFVAKDQRNILALPIEWPLIFSAEKDSYVPRGHMLRFKEANIKHNLEPFQASNIPLTKVSDVDLSTTNITLDPGHGVVYGFAPARRSQEWFVAHKVADAISDILTGTYGMQPQNILWTRTAGLGLIEPAQVHANAAPETGDGFYAFDLPQLRIRIKNNQRGLKELSNLLLTRHDVSNGDTALDVADGDRTRLLNINAATVQTITGRLNQHLAASHRQIQPGSVRWNPDSDDFVYTQERTNAHPGQDPVVDSAVHFPITPADWFTVDQGMLQVLAERSAAWSLHSEIGSGPAANAAAGRPAFQDAARGAMEAVGARQYMQDKILHYLNVASQHAYLQSGIKGWGPSPRIAYMNNNACDLYLTLHENASGGKGGVALVSVLGGADAPPGDQIRIGKIFVKYLDPFDQGVRSSGVHTEEPTNQAGMLHHANQRRATYAYLEMEFMDAINPDDDSQYTYQLMVQDQFIQTLATQIVSASLETLFNRQGDLEPVKLNNEASLLHIW